MLENISDYLSLFILILAAAGGLYILFTITDRSHHEAVQKRQERYYSFYETMDDEFEDGSGPYFE